MGLGVVDVGFPWSWCVGFRAYAFELGGFTVSRGLWTCGLGGSSWSGFRVRKLGFAYKSPL